MTLDARGEAVVGTGLAAAGPAALPGASYGLTALGSPMPDLHVAEEASETAGGGVAFRVAGGAPGGRVSWRIALGSGR